MADEPRERRSSDPELVGLLTWLGDLDRLGRRFDKGMGDCRDMFARLDRRLVEDVMPVLVDLDNKINGDPDDRERFPGLNAVVYDLAKDRAERTAIEKYQEKKRARRRLVVGTVTTIAGGGIFGLLGFILSILRQVAG